jgi:formylglycine-generating enzyme required for sulfatase activity
MDSNPASGWGVGNDSPVYDVSWDNIRGPDGFIDRINALGQGTFRLPSEAEWEYACRAGTTTRFLFGDSLGCDDFCEDCDAADGNPASGLRSDYMWWCGNAGLPTDPGAGCRTVASKFANAFGLFDMHGNVWEWCEDDWHANYTAAPNDGSAWVDSPRASDRIFRGGYWGDGAMDCRSSRRSYALPTYHSGSIGLRIAADAQ